MGGQGTVWKSIPCQMGVHGGRTHLRQSQRELTTKQGMRKQSPAGQVVRWTVVVKVMQTRTCRSLLGQLKELAATSHNHYWNQKYLLPQQQGQELELAKTNQMANLWDVEG